MTEAKPLQYSAQSGLDGLYQRYAAWLTRRLRLRLSPEDAEDVVQDTYLRLAPIPASEIRHPKAFLMSVALNLVRDRARSDARRRVAAETTQAPEARACDQFEDVLLTQVITTMPTLYRDVFVLNRFGGMTYPEIANAQGISVKTVEWRMSRALAYCASRLEL